MIIPDTCKQWAQLMDTGTEGQDRIIGNLRKDNCIEDQTEEKFYTRLGAKGNPNNSKKAWNMAIDVVKLDPDSFVCQGRQLSDKLFSKLSRLEDVKALRWHLPDQHLKKFGIRGKAFNPSDLPDDELMIVVESYTDTLNLGNQLDIVWAADNSIIEKVDLASLVDRLGLIQLESEERCLKIVYDRGSTGKQVHLPRSFDGINWAGFDVVEDCDADSGKTLPLNLPHEQGLPEAVHRGCKVKPEIFEVEPIE